MADIANTSKFHVAVIGGGPAGLMASEVLARRGAAVTVYDRMSSVGRKFLLAGRGGLNLTHSEPIERLRQRYGRAERHLRGAIDEFPPDALRAWSEALGQPTFVGSSGRVFPNAMKASPLLRAWIRHLDTFGVSFKLGHDWTGWDSAGHLMFDAPQGPVAVAPDATLLALGGASWPRLGSDGSWVKPLVDSGVEVAPLQPANCGFLVGWSEVFRARFEGQPLKRIALSFDGRTVRGEAVVTRIGLQGGGLYALSDRLREAVLDSGKAALRIDLRPDATGAALQEALSVPRGKQSLANFLRKAVSLSPAAIGLLQETAIVSSRPLAVSTPDELAGLIKAVPVELTGVEQIAHAISTAGGVSFHELDENFMLRRRPGTFVAGEMLDWEAPTGGYLLQACFATGAAAGRGVYRWLDKG